MKKFFSLFQRKSFEPRSELVALGLPLELIHAVLDFLSQPDVLIFSAVSRAWRAAAIIHPHYYLYISLHRYSVQPHPSSLLLPSRSPPFYAALSALECATTKNIRVALEVNFVRPHYDPGLLGWKDRVDAHKLNSMFRALGAALRFSVISLEITFPSYIIQRVWYALKAPAPRLRHLTAVYVPYPWFRKSKTHLISTQISESIFEGHAPYLNSLNLVRISLIDAPIQAFSSVVTARIRAEYVQEVDFGLQFPKLRELDYSLWFRSRIVGPVSLNFSQTSLCRLRLVFGDTVFHQSGYLTSHLPDVSDIEILGFSGVGLDAHWHAITGSPCTMRLEKNASYMEPRYIATVACAERRISVEPLHAWTKLRAIFGYMTQLTLDQAAISSFLGNCSLSTTFPALVSVVINVSSRHEPIWPIDAPLCKFHCPLLYEIIVTSEVQLSRSSPRTQIKPEEVDAIAYCFELTDPNVTLRFRGVEWTDTLELEL